MRAWNYLSSLLSQKAILDQQILIKTLVLIIKNYEKFNQLHDSPQAKLATAALLSNDPAQPIFHHYSMLFQHCFVQGMLQILSAHHPVISTYEGYESQTKGHRSLLQEMIRIIFKHGGGQKGLQMCSQTILCDFLKEFERHSNLTQYIFKNKQQIVQSILISQTNDLSNSSKLQTFEKIERFMPFDNFEHLHLSKLKQLLMDSLSPSN
mmetsp:Transcript_6390/g.10836  ORF Transcript_6390/g.10836 Transcript_6390/m.10836 type:complete len:208 (-) Transcript_6390:74-697(-)